MATTPAGESDSATLDFEDYVRSRQESLLRSARRLVPDPSDAQDLVQTALCRTFPRWELIADKGLADAYMRRVMINTRTEWWRSRKLEEVPTDKLPDTSIDDGTEQHADRAMLLGALEVLAPKQRQVVVLRHWEQMSTEETARVLGMSIGTVKSTLHRALARLREEIERMRDEPELVRDEPQRMRDEPERTREESGRLRDRPAARDEPRRKRAAAARGREEPGRGAVQSARAAFGRGRTADRGPRQVGEGQLGEGPCAA